MKKFINIAVAALLISLVTTTAFAHKIRVFAYAEGDRIVGEAAFNGGKSAKNVVIEIYSDNDDQLLTTTTTDAQGEFSFPIPEIARKQQIDLRIVVNGGDGHHNSWLLNSGEYLATTVPSQNETTVVAPQPQKIEVPQPLPAPSTTQQQISEETLRQLVEESVEKQLRPVKRMLAETREQKTSLQDILGGFGYIFGLAGVAAYFSSRKKNGRGEKQ